MRSKNKVTCRPCKEEKNWEIEGPDGTVYSKHYQTKAECVKAGRKYAEEFGCDLQIENLKNQSGNNQSKK